MSRPKHLYPNRDRRYPNPEPEPGELSQLGLAPSFEAKLARLAPSRATVLLLGGTPVLKRAVARALHQRSARASQPFVAFDCRELGFDEIDDRLFGGPAYTSATGGAIERTEAGTLYIAAIDELPLLTQPRFLRFLDQERKARVVAATVGDLLTRVEHGLFRLDLAERLTLVELLLPGGG